MPKQAGSRGEPRPCVDADHMVERVSEASEAGDRIAPWNVPYSLETLARLVCAFDMPPQACAQRYRQVTLPAHDRGWRFHAALGFTKRR